MTTMFQFPEAGHFDSYVDVSEVRGDPPGGFQFPEAGHFDSYNEEDSLYFVRDRQFQFPEAGHFDSYTWDDRFGLRYIGSFNSLKRDILILTRNPQPTVVPPTVSIP